MLPDAAEGIAAQLMEWADSGECDLIVSTGGTGGSLRDVTPEATQTVLDREIPGFAEAIPASRLRETPYAILSRAVAGIRGRTLIVNLPGSPKSAVESLEAVWAAIPHAVKKIQGDTEDWIPAGRGERVSAT